LTGRVDFAFASKYKTGATVPTGQSLLEFRAGNLTFLSDASEWLVVAGARAQYKGVGRINGKGDFGFLITAANGQVNGEGSHAKLRMKIWERASGKVVYDNQLGAPDDANPTTGIQGGAIVIHSH
jgi:hypothetical protein